MDILIICASDQFTLEVAVAELLLQSIASTVKDPTESLTLTLVASKVDITHLLSKSGTLIVAVALVFSQVTQNLDSHVALVIDNMNLGSILFVVRIVVG